MKKIKIWFESFWESFDMNDNIFVRSLRKRVDVILDSQNPDYVFFTRFDSQIYKYPNAIRIFYNAENFAPDFNLCDYAIGFDEIEFNDRYLRYPLYLIPDYTYYPNDNYAEDLRLALAKNEFTVDELSSKEGFCSIVVSRGGCREREEFFDILSKYKQIASGGRWRNNIGGPVDDKCEFVRKYKFTIAFENSSTPGYTTEKLMQAFAAKTVPIYFGNPHIDQEFNSEAFINVHQYSSWEDVVSAIKRIDQDDEKYMRMMKTPAFVEGLIEKKREELDRFLWHIVDQSKEEALRRQGQLIQKYEKKYKIGTELYRLLVKASYVRLVIKNKIRSLTRGEH